MHYLLVFYVTHSYLTYECKKAIAGEYISTARFAREALLKNISHLDFGKICQCTGLLLHQSDAVEGSRADGGPQKAEC